MKKKIMAAVAALAIMAVGTTAFATGSPSAGDTTVEPDPDQKATVETVAAPTDSVEDMAEATSADTDVEGLEIESKPVGTTTVSQAALAATDAISNLSDLADVVDSEELKAAAKDETKVVSATIKAVVNLEVTEGEIPDEGVTLTIKNDGIKAGNTYVILHYVAETKTWEKIKATNVKDKSLDILVKSLSPVAIVEVSVDDKEEAAATDPTTAAPSAAATTAATTAAPTTAATTAAPSLTVDTNTANDATTAAATTEAASTTEGSAASGTSPATGETTPVALFALLACVAGAVLCTKKSEKN
jgi:hypothetical protein